MKNTYLLFLLFFVAIKPVSAQTLQDNFSDGDFTTNPVWTGNTADFIVNGTNQLQTNNLGVADTSQLSTTASMQDSTFWEFMVQMNFSPSATNRAQIYLQSDNPVLNSTSNGYYMRIGMNGAVDSIEIFRVTSGAATKVFGGTASQVSVNPIASFRIIRNSVGFWQVFADYTGGTTYALEGTFTDATHPAGGYFGFWTKYTTTNGDKFFFDNVYISPLVTDVTPPSIDSVAAISSTQVDVYFDEIVDLTTANDFNNYTIDNGATVSNATRDGSNFRLVHLTTSTLTSALLYTLTVNAVEDLNNNAINNGTDNFIYYNIQTAAFQDIIINEIHADPTPVVGLPDAEFVELLNRSNKIINLSGMVFNDGTDKILPSYLLFPDSMVILTTTANLPLFTTISNKIGLSSMALTNSGELLSLKNAGATIDSVLYDLAWYQDAIKDDGGWTLELINPNVLCLGAANWIASNHVSGGTPGAQNSVYNNSPDVQGPSLLSANFVDNITIQLVFDENLNAATASVIGNYNVAGLTISNASFTPPSTVTLTVSPMVDQTTYTVVVSNLTDCSGNTIGVNNTDNFTFVNVQAPAFQDIIINEIHADPDPVVGLPNAEFVELYNRSTKTINLGGMILNDGSNHALPSHILAPNAYVILTSTTFTAAYSAFGTTLDIGTVTLTNSGELLQLKDNNGNTIDSVLYDLTWYQDAVKDDGGWTLELINPTVLCRNAANWIASNNVSGGTPGTQNSVYDNTPDTQGPSLVNVNFLDNITIELVFDEILDATTASLIGNYVVAGLTISNASFTSPSTVTLTVSPMVDQTNYTVVVSNLTDCSGNIIGVNNSNNFTYVDIQPASFQDIIITEIHADPDPVVSLPNGEFVELYNRSTKNINLGGMIFNDGSNHVLPTHILAPNQYVILTSTAFVTTYSGFGTTLNTGTMALTNSGELLQLRDNNGNTIDSVLYDLTWYQDAVKDDGGWTLELINPTVLCRNAANWIASNNVSGGTPGTQNSVYDNTPDTQGPSLVSVNFLDSITIELVFDENLDAATASVIGNYAVAGLTVSNALFTPPGTVVLTVSPMVDQTNYTGVVSNLTDCSGNIIGVNNTSNFTYLNLEPAAFQDIIITEIHSDPDPVVGLPNAEFVELYNRSTKNINLGGMIFSDGSNHVLPMHILTPNTYVILTSTAFVPTYSVFGTTLSTGSIALTNSGELLELRDNNGSTIDSVLYDLAWYQDAVKDDGGWTLELINPNLLCKGASNWIASNHSSGGSPGIQNSVYNNTPDLTPPAIVLARQSGTNQIRLEFDDVLNTTIAGNAAIYSVNNGAIVNTAVVLSNTEVLLTLAVNMIDQTVYTITINNLEDCVGNSTGTITTTMTYYKTDLAKHYDLIINEIMSDPNPTVGLPEKEYVEIFNRSNKTFNLENFTLKDGSSVTSVLPFFILHPGDYVTICSAGDTISFASFGKVLPVSPFPDLNTSDELILRDPMGDVIDAVAYDLDWYQNADKDDGGWSLERINPNRPCEAMTNWRASENLLGGTPSAANSVLNSDADTQAPDALRAFPLSADSVRVYFSEAIADSAGAAIANYTIDNGISVLSARLELPFYNSVVLLLNQPLVLGTTYLITMSVGLTDCIGNPIALKNTARVALPQAIQSGDLILNEVLFNPVTSGSDFIELYNTSNKVLNTADLVISNTEIIDGNLANTSSLQTRPVNIDWLVFPNEYVVITEDADQVRSQYATPNPENFVENDIPTFDDKDGHVFLYAAYDSTYLDGFGNPQTAYLAKVLDLFDYEESFHSPLIDDKNGVSLERIDFDAPTNDRNNWHSAATEVGYATPAYQNSSFVINNITGSDLIELPTETVSPDGDGYQDFLLINYNVDALGYVANIDIYDATGRLIRNLVNGEMLTMEGSLQWDGTDNEGRKARVGIHILAVEIFDGQGNVKRFKKTCIVAGRMN